jgi:hypothetical protein
LFILLCRKRSKKDVKDIGYSLYLYLLGLEYKNTVKLQSKKFLKISYGFTWKWVQPYRTEKNFSTREEEEENV